MLEELAGAGSRDLVAMLWMVFAILADVRHSHDRSALAALHNVRGAPSRRRGRRESACSSRATLVSVGLLVDDVGTRIATLAWALQGAALLVVGIRRA